MKAAHRLRERLVAKGIPFAANDSIGEHLEPGELEALQPDVEAAVAGLLDALVIDRDHNTRDTAKRVAKMYLHEVMAGRYYPKPAVTDFPNVKHLDELYAVGPISVRSMCSHHMVPIMGRAWVGVIPSDRVIGLSKFNRLTQWVMARPQIQEEAAVQLADAIEALVNPLGIAVVLRAEHMCMTWRGVREAAGAEMVTSIMRGRFREDGRARAEFLSLVEAR